MILGAVLAGGRSSRFGSDKALAELGGDTLLARAVDLLAPWCEDVVVVGRDSAPAPTIRDWPHADMGPLGGIAAALRHARELELEAVLSIGVDAVGLPDDLPHLLSPAPAFLDSQPVIGLWPTTVLAAVERILEGDDKHSMRALAAAIGARAVKLGAEPANINTPADLEAAEKHHGL